MTPHRFTRRTFFALATLLGAPCAPEPSRRFRPSAGNSGAEIILPFERNPRARAPARSPNGELLPAAGPAFFRTNSRASGKAGAEQSS